MLEAERDWVIKIAKEIADGRLEWRTGKIDDIEGLRRRHGASTH
jgi:hypothetical protein